MSKIQERQLLEARHLIRKHVIKSRHHGKAVLYKCRECGANGADTVDGIVHSPECRVALLLNALGDHLKVGSPKAPSEKPTSPTHCTIPSQEKSGKAHDPVAAALECSS